MTRKKLVLTLAVLMAFANGVFASAFFNWPRQQTVALSFASIGILALAITSCTLAAVWIPQKTS